MLTNLTPQPIAFNLPPIPKSRSMDSKIPDIQKTQVTVESSPGVNLPRTLLLVKLLKSQLSKHLTKTTTFLVLATSKREVYQAHQYPCSPSFESFTIFASTVLSVEKREKNRQCASLLSSMKLEAFKKHACQGSKKAR